MRPPQIFLLTIFPFYHFNMNTAYPFLSGRKGKKIYRILSNFFFLQLRANKKPVV